MNISPELEKLVRQLLALGVAVVIVITAPGGAGGTGTGGSPQTIVLTPTAMPRPSSGVPRPSRSPQPSTTASPSADAGGTAAEAFGWGEPNRVDEFDAGNPGEGWTIYDGPGHDGQGTRSPSAVGLVEGILKITGDASGTTAGMAWNPGQAYGRWEARVKAPAGNPSYHALLLLWPDAEDWPVGGEIDFMEMMEPTRQVTNMFVHYGADNSQVSGEVKVDGTQWRNWAVEWTPDHIAAFVDGKEWYRTTEPAAIPSRPMHLCIQLDYLPGGGNAGNSTMEIDWVRQYAAPGA
ncbi:MAG: glycoside hydrolase family 16 protein [Pseudonocardiales bacterium]|nr:glycoside hydrolase family 16 protein [Pseudonocardiales bacterium]